MRSMIGLAWRANGYAVSQVKVFDREVTYRPPGILNIRTGCASAKCFFSCSGRPGLGRPEARERTRLGTHPVY
jgi:hypothetical protein